MVFRTPVLFKRILRSQKTPDPDPYWRKRRILMIASHFYGRSQRCYKLAFRAVNRSLKFATIARKFKHRDRRAIFETRLNAACEEHGFSYTYFKESLIRSNVLLNKKILADLAIWEPRTFKCLNDFAWKKAAEEGLKGIGNLGDPPAGVILRPMHIK